MKLADGHYWIDDYGAWNHVALGDFCPFFANPGLRTGERTDLAFRRLGMVRVSKRRGVVTVQWDESLDSACAFLWNAPGAGLTKLRFYCGGWAHEVYDSVRSALVRMEVLRSYRNVTPFPGVRIRSLDDEAMEKGTTATIERARRLFAEKRALLGSDLWSRLAKENLVDRVLLFQEEDDGSRLSYRYIGPRSLFSQIFGTEVSKNLIGRHCSVDPATKRRGCSYSRAYPQVLASGHKQIDQVLAPIKRSDDDGIWVSYQRILVPCSASNGRKVLLVLTDPTEEKLIAA